MGEPEDAGVRVAERDGAMEALGSALPEKVREGLEEVEAVAVLHALAVSVTESVLLLQGVAVAVGDAVPVPPPPCWAWGRAAEGEEEGVASPLLLAISPAREGVGG